MYEAGVPLERALRVSGGQASGGQRRAPFAVRAETVARAVAAGRDLVQAGTEAGLFSERDAGVLRAAAEGGRLGPMLLRLGEWYRLQAEHAGTVKRQLALPVFVVAAVVFLGPVPALVLGRLDVAGYLQRTLLPLAALVILARLWLRARRPWHRPRAGADRLLVRLPGLGPHLVRRQLVRWFASMALLAEAGVAIGDAARLARDTVTLPVLWRAFDDVARRLPRGESLESALAGNRWVEPDARYLIASGEQSGRLPDMLWRVTRAQESRVEQFEREVAKWGPRVLYFLVLLWLAWGLAGRAREIVPVL